MVESQIYQWVYYNYLLEAIGVNFIGYALLLQLYNSKIQVKRITFDVITIDEKQEYHINQHSAVTIYYSSSFRWHGVAWL